MSEGSVTIAGGNSFSYLVVDLPPGQSIRTEAGAMASMDDGIELRTALNGGFIGALLIKFLGSETMFTNIFTNTSATSKRVYLTQPTPGSLVCEKLVGEPINLQPGAYLASTTSVGMRIRWAGLSSWLAGEGLFRLQVSGQGFVWFGSYGAIVEKEINGSLIVDSGHLLSYPPSVSLKAQFAGGLITSFLSGEGIVLRLTGRGRIRLQTRSISSLASWVNPWFR